MHGFCLQESGPRPSALGSPNASGGGAVTSAEPGATFPMTGRQMWASGTYQLLSLGAETITFPFGGNGLGLFIFSNLMNIKRTVIGAK